MFEFGSVYKTKFFCYIYASIAMHVCINLELAALDVDAFGELQRSPCRSMSHFVGLSDSLVQNLPSHFSTEGDALIFQTMTEPPSCPRGCSRQKCCLAALNFALPCLNEYSMWMARCTGASPVLHRLQQQTNPSLCSSKASLCHLI